MNNHLRKRKTTRLSDADYNESGIFFLTICTKNKECMLSQIVGTGVPDGPSVKLTEYGEIAERFINQLSNFYCELSVEEYVIMPNHIHLLLTVNKNESGPSRTPVPTVQNSTVSRFISTFKRFCNREYGENIWQYRSYDHIIRNLRDYEQHVRYISENPLYWKQDRLYSEK